MSRLALFGGKPVRTKPFPKRAPFGPDEEREVLEALRSQNLFFPTGSKVYRFIEEFKKLFNVKYAVASTSGTAAIHVALGALNLNPGDEVITSPITDMGTVAPILLQNCIPVFADVDIGTYCIDPEDVERKITDKTRAIIVVHCWGQPADMYRIMEIARKHDLYVIEDCAQAHYVHYKGRLTGTMGDLGAFSFQMSKHITCGDGGLTITNSEEFARRMELFIDKGCDWTPDRRYRLKYEFLAPCYRMTELQGAVLLAQLRKLPWVVRRRQELGDLLTKKISNIPGLHPLKRIEGVECGYWSYPIRIEEEVLNISRDLFMKALSAEGIPVGGPWPGKPLYLYSMLKNQVTYGDSRCPFSCPRYGRQIEYREGLCPRAEMLEQQHFTIPINEFYAEEDIEDIAEAIHKVAEYLPEEAERRI